MRRTATILFLSLLVNYAVGQDKDSCDAGVYLSKQDFINNKVSHKINTGAKGYRFEFPFPANWKLVIKIVTPDTTLLFRPGSVYGYFRCNHAFRYSPGGELYADEDYYRVEEIGGLVIYTSVFNGGDEYYYSRKLDSPIHRLRLKNLESDFKDNPEFVSAAKKLNKKDELGDLTQRDENGNYVLNNIYKKTMKK